MRIKTENDIGSKKNIALVVIALLFYSTNIINGIIYIVIMIDFGAFELLRFYTLSHFSQALLWSAVLYSFVEIGRHRKLLKLLKRAEIVIDMYANNGSRFAGCMDALDEHARKELDEIAKGIGKFYGFKLQVS